MSMVRYNRNRLLSGVSRGVRSLYNARGRVGSAVGFAAGIRSRQRNARSQTFSRRRKTMSSGQGVTTQHDARLIYRKKRMPRFKRRSWKRFRGKVLAVSEKDLGTQQVVFNRVLPPTSNQTPGQQFVYDFCLYGLKSGFSWWNDLSQISSYLANAATTPGTGLTIDPSTKIIFHSGILDVTVRNNSTNNGSPDSLARMEVDVYEMTVRHTGEEAGATYNSLIGLLAQNTARTLPIGGGATSEIDYISRGVTPFDLSYVTSRFGVVINKKTKYQLSNGDQFTYQMRDPMRRSIVFREMQNQDGFNKPGWTKCVYVVGKLAAGLTIGAVGTANVFQEALIIGCTRKYSFKVENYSEDRTAYDAL